MMPPADYFATAPVNAIKALGHGLINDTYRVITETGTFVLQKLNRQVFPEPGLVIDNWLHFSRHLAGTKNRADLHLPVLLPGRNGEFLLQTETGDFWRAMTFIDHGQAPSPLNHPDQARTVGRALARFHRLLIDLPPDSLRITVPNFHQTPVYLADYQALTTKAGLIDDERAAFCRAMIEQKTEFSRCLENARQSGQLATRIMHGDPKLDNFLFDRSGHHVISLIDLDTVGPGLWHYDIGDCLRSLAGQSDGTFNWTLAKAFLAGYQSIIELTQTEQALLPTAIELIPFELGLRFFTDYLTGNRYFKTTYPEHNLERAVVQFKISETVRQEWGDFKFQARLFSISANTRAGCPLAKLRSEIDRQ